VARIGDRRGEYTVLVGRSEGKRLLGRPNVDGENTIKMDVQEVGWRRVVWIDLAQDRDR
jgi:hypothetical protein